jgi:FkbM family methyltransferase
MDLELLQNKYYRFNNLNKINYILIKYLNIIKKQYDTISGKQIIYESKYGCAGQQRLLVSHIYQLSKLVKNNDLIVVDVGANYGHFSNLFSIFFNTKKIISIEADPTTYEKLSHNTSSKMELKNICIGGKDGDYVYFHSDPNSSYLGKVINEQELIGYEKKYIKKLEIKTLDSVLENELLIDVLKIDVEGHEDEVLKGAHNTLKKVKYLFIETSKNEKNTFSELIRKLSTNDYNFELLYVRNLCASDNGKYTSLDLLLKNKLK